MSGAGETEERPSAVKSILRNAGWLLGGKGFGAVSSLLYLAILSRSLGVKDFGHFALIFGLAQTVVALAGFQTWQTIVRFGAPHLAAGKDEAFGRLSVFGGLIDAVGATIGCLVTVLGFRLFGAMFDVNPAYDDAAVLFICAMLWARVSAPYGIIRALDRFELTVIVGAITPAARLLAAIGIWLAGASVYRFLIAWAAIEFVTAGALWLAAYRLRPELLQLSHLREWRRTLQENPGIAKFLGITYANTSVLAVIHQGPLLAVGYLFGTSAAGVYRIADQLAKGLGKLATLLSDAVYPEVNKQLHATPAAQFRKLIRQVSVSVLIISVIVVVLAFTLGDDLLILIAGEDFGAGAVVLVPLVLAASFELASVSYESVLHSVGKPHYQLFTRIGVLAAMAILVFALPHDSSLGVGWSVAAAHGLEYLVMTVVIMLVLRTLVRRSAER